MDFAHKEFFWLFLLLPLMVGWYVWQYRRSYGEIQMSSLQGFSSVKTSAKEITRHGLFLLRLMAFSAFIVVLARPQSSTSWQDVTSEGIDIIIALDISGSMLAEDLKPNRLEASKRVAMEFIDDRPNDRIGLVVYSGESFTQCPLTTDHSVLKNLFKDIKNGMIVDGTAIGMGLANGVLRLKESNAKSKVVILLTDGFNTTGKIPPLTAAEIAKSEKIRVYTVGVGTKGMAPYPFRNPLGGIVYQNIEVKIDEGLLKNIAEMTGGQYFRATNNKKLKAIYKEIDKLEKSKIEEVQYTTKHELFFPLAAIGSILILIEFLLKNTVFKSIT
ncbi:MAG: aerotolerance regulator BatA [Flavobacteriales bacterium]|nr:MAG: aerotolerance regulator BatA [Flavobacteriales bacterium]